MADLEARIVGLEMWVKGHETLCAERYRNLNTNIDAVGKAVAGQNRIMVSIAASVALIAVGVIGWLGVQLLDRQNERVAQIEARHGQ